MKLLVFAFKPPPHHGQSYMVQLLLEALGGDVRERGKNKGTSQEIECYHVDCRVSESSTDTGRIRVGKLFALLKYCVQAVVCRFRYGVRNFYYVPAPGVRSAIYRDWVVMTLCRPFFSKIIFHWHGVGLGDWLEKHGSALQRTLTHRLLNGADLSIVLGEYYRADAEKFHPNRIEVVPNGIPDPCPDFAPKVLPRREARRAARVRLLNGDTLSNSERNAAGADPEIFRIVFLGLCVHAKGLFDTLESVALLRAKLARTNPPLKVHLVVAGKFPQSREQTEFEERIAQPDLNGPAPVKEQVVEYRGFVAGADKDRLMRESDCLCFPTYYPIEGHPVTVVEALAYGLGVVTTRWRAMPEFFDANYAGLVEPRAPEQLALVLEQSMREESSARLREIFLEKFTLDQFAARMRKVLTSVEK